jgi:hypothetical protein
MAGSFNSIGFRERGQGSGQGIPVWSTGGVVVIKHIPGSSKNVIQKLGTTRPRIAMPVRVTAAQLTSLFAALGTSASLVFHFETTTATLESITNVEEYFHGLEAYSATLNLIRSSGDFGTTPSGARITEAGDTRITESSDTRIIE